MAKLNDFYYQLEDWKGWHSWREVCEMRREFGSIKIIAKEPCGEHIRRLTPNAGDEVTQKRNGNSILDT